MYIPEQFKETDPERISTFIESHSFGMLVTAPDGVPFVSHLPFIFDAAAGSKGKLLCHMARANPQWEHFSSCGEVLVIFQGPHAYPDRPRCTQDTIENQTKRNRRPRTETGFRYQVKGALNRICGGSRDMPVMQQVRKVRHGIQRIQNRPVDKNIAGVREMVLVEPAGHTENEINDPTMRGHSI